MATKSNAKVKSVKKKSKVSVDGTKVPVLKDPSDSLFGKIVVWILIFGMGAIIIVSLVVAIVLQAIK
ncbi:MAG: hypothetical protein LBV51_00640 [Acholeplasmatales bacterium]|jgi:hypothetical protein|nr:hypothetical protein [Acholeplasmatales bacterium]